MGGGRGGSSLDVSGLLVSLLPPDVELEESSESVLALEESLGSAGGLGVRLSEHAAEYNPRTKKDQDKEKRRIVCQSVPDEI